MGGGWWGLHEDEGFETVCSLSIKASKAILVEEHNNTMKLQMSLTAGIKAFLCNISEDMLCKQMFFNPPAKVATSKKRKEKKLMFLLFRQLPGSS